MPLPVIELETEDRSLESVEERGKGATLSKSSGFLEELCGLPVYQWCYPGPRDTSFDPVNEGGGETKSLHHLEQKSMPYPVEHIC